VSATKEAEEIAALKASLAAASSASSSAGDPAERTSKIASLEASLAAAEAAAALKGAELTSKVAALEASLAAATAAAKTKREEYETAKVGADEVAVELAGRADALTRELRSAGAAEEAAEAKATTLEKERDAAEAKVASVSQEAEAAKGETKEAEERAGVAVAEIGPGRKCSKCPATQSPNPRFVCQNASRPMFETFSARALEGGGGVARPDGGIPNVAGRRADAIRHGCRVPPGRGVIENKHSTDVESLPPPPRVYM